MAATPSITVTDQPDISIGGVEPSRPKAERMSLLIWGPSGVGKTTLASTLPGHIALINFDPDGPASIPDAENVTVFDLSGTGSEIVPRLKSGDPLGLKQAMEHFDSFIIDSLTTITERTLAHGITVTKGATIERPSPGAYGARNAVANEFVRNVLAITAAHKKHLALIAHEGPPNSNDDGVILDITLALGGQLPQNIGLRVNEIWCMFEDAKNRKMVMCRKSRMRVPIKSRMFDTMTTTEFEWKWNTRDRDDPDNMWIRDWFEQWKENGFKKIPMPT